MSGVLDRLGQAQHATVGWRQLREAGATPGWIKGQVEAGRLIRLAPGAYRVVGTPRTWCGGGVAG